MVALICVTAIMTSPVAAEAEKYRLSFEDAMKRAGERAPAVAIERARVGEAEARRVGASVRLRENPEIEAMAGRRTGAAGGPSTDLDLALTQMFELGGKRSARIAGAGAGVDRARASAQDSVRRTRLDVAIRFYRALHAAERLGLAREGAASADAFLRATEQRVRKGDAAVLELNLAKVARATAHAAALASQADSARSLDDLALALGFDPDDSIELVGSLETTAPDPQLVRVTNLVAEASNRPDIAALRSEEREGLAEERLGKALRWPDVGLRVSYGREADEEILLGGLVVRLPFFDRGQEARAVGRARGKRAALERAVLVRSLGRDIEARHARYLSLLEAARAFKAQAAPLLDETDKLLARSFDTGLIGLGDYLAFRRETLEARREHLDRLLELAEARVELLLTAGVMP